MRERSHVVALGVDALSVFGKTESPEPGRFGKDALERFDDDLIFSPSAIVTVPPAPRRPDLYRVS